MSLREQLQCIANGESIDHCHNFYDWFCRDSALPLKAKLLWGKVRKFLKIVSIDVDVTYVFFKNNCPMGGPLYDSFSICDRESGDVLFWVTGKSGHNGKAEAFSKAVGFSEPLAQAPTFSELLKLI